MKETFRQFPAFLTDDPRYHALPNDAKLLYTFLLDRRRLSLKNHWQDANGVFVIFTRAEMAKFLNCSVRKVIRLAAQLKEAGLIREKRQGLNKPNLIYILHPDRQNPASVKKNLVEDDSVVKEIPKDAEAQENDGLYADKETGRAYCAGPERQNRSCLDARKCQTNHTEYSHTDNNHTDISDLSVFLSNHTEDRREEADRSEYMFYQIVQRVKQQIHFDALNEDGNFFTQRKLDALVNLVSYVYALDDQAVVRVNNTDMPAKLVKMQFERIDHLCISYIMDAWDENESQVRNVRAYLLTTLYNAPDTVDFYCENRRDAF